MVDLQVNIGKIKLINPITLASGTAGYGEELSDLYDLSKLGAIWTKGVSLKPIEGNPMPRTVETASGMLNSIGLQNVGVEAFLRDKLPRLRKLKIKSFVNFFGNSIDDYAAVAEKLDGQDGISGLEVNISCPNIKSGGIQFGTDPKMASKVVKKVRKKTKLPIIVKLSPNVTDISEIARAVEGAGADAVSLINTLAGMAINIETRKPVLANIIGGLSGPAIKPVALKMVWQVYNAVKIPIIGIGGIMCVEDVIQFILAGASAVQVGTASFVNPIIGLELVKELYDYCVDNDIKNIADIVGALET